MASNKHSDVKYIAISRMTDRKVLMKLNPQEGKQSYDQEVSDKN